MKKLTTCYENQINNQRIEFEKKFDKGMKKAFGGDIVTDTFIRDTDELKSQSVQGYKNLCEQLILDGSDWRYDLSLNELGKLLPITNTFYYRA
jgi:hypothetical protein